MADWSIVVLFAEREGFGHIYRFPEGIEHGRRIPPRHIWGNYIVMVTRVSVLSVLLLNSHVASRHDLVKGRFDKTHIDENPKIYRQ